MAFTRFSLLVPCIVSILLGLARGSAVDVQRRDQFLPARVPYVLPAPGTDPIADAIRERRGNGTLLALDGALLNAPLVAQGWNQFFTVIRENLTIPGDMRELFILRTAALNKAAYQWGQHESVGRAEGLTTRQLQILRLTPPGVLTHTEQKILGDKLAAAVAFADAITTSVHVPDHVYHNLARFLSNKQMVEAVSTAGSYAFVSRFTVALNVDGLMNALVPVP
ncbi:putative glycosidase C21B10.07 [Favolaschia claudopus]|uniref:Glycosidase C21B10.07 n=1 Tax=Favolaschia claudopus TaxID=2862362 RepID=A0AAW0EDC4_9AGAR